MCVCACVCLWLSQGVVWLGPRLRHGRLRGEPQPEPNRCSGNPAPNEARPVSAHLLPLRNSWEHVALLCILQSLSSFLCSSLPHTHICGALLALCFGCARRGDGAGGRGGGRRIDPRQVLETWAILQIQGHSRKNFSLTRRSHFTRFTRAQSIPMYVVGLGSVDEARVGAGLG